MKLHLTTILTAGVLLIPAQAADKTELKDDKDKLSCSLRMNVGRFVWGNELELDIDTFLQALRDRAAGKPTLLTDQEYPALMNQLLRTNQVRRLARTKEQGEKFLEENKTKPGVVALPSGMQYKILTEGSGPQPKTNDVVTVHYRGTLIDGKEFDSSYQRNQPATFNLGGVIKGWTEGVSMMKKGAKWQLFIPSSLAYGDNAGPGGGTPPGATLTFEIELINFETPPAPKPPPLPQPVTSDIIKVPSKEEMEKGAKIEVIKPEELERLQKEQQLKEQQLKEKK